MNEEDQNKRGDSRKLPINLVGVFFTLPADPDGHMGLVNDISHEGLGITSVISVLPGTLLQIFPGENDEEIIFGEVRWCIPAGLGTDGYYLGIRAIKR